MAFPQVFVDINRNNQSQDWQVNLDLGVGFFSDYYFKPDRSGWYVGNQIASQQFTVKLDELAQTFSNVLIMPYGGYR